MEIIGVIVFFAFLVAIEERRVNKRLWAPGPCAYCHDTVFMDRKRHLWIHRTSGLQRAVFTKPLGIEKHGITHLAIAEHSLHYTPEDYA